MGLSHRINLHCVLFIAVAASTFVGCSADSSGLDGDPAIGEYFRALRAIEAAHEAEIRPLHQAAFDLSSSAADDEPPPAGLRNLYVQIASANDRFVQQIEALSPPSSLSDLHARVFIALRANQSAFRALVDALGKSVSMREFSGLPEWDDLGEADEQTEEVCAELQLVANESKAGVRLSCYWV